MKNGLLIILSSCLLASYSIILSGCNKDDDDKVTTVEDVDGNVYTTTTIGTQVWMTSELRTTMFCDGSPIPLVTDDSEWDNTDESAYCWYNNDQSLFDFALYNWYVVESDCLCPEGWHVPSESEWDILKEFLGGQEVAGGKMKQPDMWFLDNSIGNNEYGFTAIPTGRREAGVGFLPNNSEEGGWWTSTPHSATRSKTRYLRHEDTELKSGNLPLNDGISVRCIKD